MISELTGISLFSGGADGISEAMIAAGIKVIAHVEIDPFCRRVLRKNHPDSLILEDVKHVGSHNLPHADVIFGGAPCQPFSTAGNLRGTDDDRHLWPEMYRVIRELEPAAVLFENVANAANMVLPLVRSDLEAAGYKVWPFIVPASGVGAPHERKRLWVVAYADQYRRHGTQTGYGLRNGEQHDPPSQQAGRTEFYEIVSGSPTGKAVRNSDRASRTVGGRRLRADAPHAHSYLAGLDVRNPSRPIQHDQPDGTGEIWGIAESDGSDQIVDRRDSPQPKLGRTPDGLPDWTHFIGTWSGFPAPLNAPPFDFEPPRTVRKGEIPNRAKRVVMLGNAVVPQQAYPFCLAIAEFLRTGD